MSSRGNIQARATVIEVLKDEAYRVELVNGHRCIVRASREDRLKVTPLATGDHVQVEFHPYDLSRGRIAL